MRNALLAALFLALAVASSFFVVFAAVLTDGPASLLHPERLVQAGLVAGATFLVAFLPARLLPWPWWSGVAIAAAPCIPWLLFGLRDQGPSPVWWMLTSLVLVGAGAGGWVGGRLRRRAT